MQNNLRSVTKALPFYCVNNPGKMVGLGLYLPLIDENKDSKPGEVHMQGHSFIHSTSHVQCLLCYGHHVRGRGFSDK